MLLINRNFRINAVQNQQQIKTQTGTLIHLLKKAKSTQFGEQFKFNTILKQEDILEAFRQSVPLSNYERFYNPWIAKTEKNRKNIIWPNKINYFALSSGTTNEASKKIPVSKEMLKNFFKETRKQALRIHNMDFPKSFYTTSCLTLGGSTLLKRNYKASYGDLSGILQKTTPFIYRPFKKPGKKTSSITDWDEKLSVIIKKAPKWNIGSIAGVPNWILLVLEGVTDHYGLKNIHEIWPNFQLCLHGGIELGTYRGKIEGFCGKPITFLNTYLASEGYFAYQEHPKGDEMKLLTSNGIYYEFIDKKNFKDVQKNNFNFNTLSWSQIEKDEEYGLVISTNSGLWRYILGDTIKFTNDELSIVKFQGRIQQTMSAIGEHLSLSNLTAAIQKTAEILAIDLSEFCVYFDADKNQHKWFVGSQNYKNPNVISAVLDDQLKMLNDDYNHLRNYVLEQPEVKILPTAKFYEFLRQQNKMGGQNKFPRVLNCQQVKQWQSFLSS
jgi:hypothetical protein